MLSRDKEQWLKDCWSDIWQRLEHRVPPGPKRRPTPFSVIRRAYTEPHRHYHDLEHVWYCMSLLRTYQHMAKDYDLVALALTIHDIVYHTYPRPKGLPSNEAMSAAIGDEIATSFGLTLEPREKLFGLVMASEHSPDAKLTKDEQLIADIDWSPLGLPWERFLEDTDKIRKEYHYYSDQDFRKGRIGALRWMLNRKKQFYLPEFRKRYENQALSNIRRSLAMLEREAA